MNSTAAPDEIQLGVSACLLGQPVRYDGDHRRDERLVERWSAFVRWVPVCPEVEAGMGVPRETVRLARGPDGGTLMLGSASDADWTERIEAFAAERLRGLPPLDGYVFKSKSPSCGIARVVRFTSRSREAPARRDGVGLFAAAFRRAFPHLAVEDERRLADPRRRSRFVLRVCAQARLRSLLAATPPRDLMGALEAFHEAQALLLAAHEARGRRSLAHFVGGDPRALAPAALAARYAEAYGTALARAPTRRGEARAHGLALAALAPALDEATLAMLGAALVAQRSGVRAAADVRAQLGDAAWRVHGASLLAQSLFTAHPHEAALIGRS